MGGWATWVIWCSIKKLCTRRYAWAGALPWRSCPSLDAHSFGLLNHSNSFQGGMFKLNAKPNADLSLYSLSHFECGTHAPWRANTTSTDYNSETVIVHTCAYSSPLSSAARLHQCRVNCSCYINNGWNFSGQTSYIRYTSNSIHVYLKNSKPYG